MNVFKRSGMLDCNFLRGFTYGDYWRGRKGKEVSWLRHLMRKKNFAVTRRAFIRRLPRSHCRLLTF